MDQYTLNCKFFLLKEFFKYHGLLANIPENYRYYVYLSMKNYISSVIKKPILHQPHNSPDKCINDGLSYEYLITENNNVVGKIPAITDDGYFIIDGEKKVLLIQEIKLKTEHYTYNNPPTCECNILGSYVPIKVFIKDNSVLHLDTSMIYKDIKNTMSIGIYEILVEFFKIDLSDVYITILEYCYKDEALAQSCMIFLLETGLNGLQESDMDVIKLKIFCNEPNSTILFTVLYMCIKCIKLLYDIESPSDRDDYRFKRLRTPGEIIYSIIRQCVLNKPKDKLDVNLQKIYTCLKRGEINVNNVMHKKMAVQFSERSYIDSLSSIRKVVIPCDDNSTNMNMRQIHASQIGFICPCETPEGKTVGLIKYLSMHCLISKHDQEETNEITKLLNNILNQNISNNNMYIWVMINGAIKGKCNKKQAIYIIENIKNKYKHVSCSFDKKSKNIIQIRTTAGRPIRPLLAIKNHPIDWSDVDIWSNMINTNKIVYLDSVECDNYNIVALDYNGSWKNASYMEIHPCTMLGLAASLIPFPEHNQSARNVFSSSMIKQSLQMINYEKVCTILQKPLVSTIIGRTLSDENVNGVNLLTCIMSITGFNQEDAIIIKKSCIDRGLFSTVVKKTVCIIANNPWKITYNESCVYVVSCGIETKLTETNSMYSKSNILSIKHKNYNTDQTLITITFIEHRTIELGDKLSSRHGQKGVIGLIMNEEDMPFTKEGITPDIIINPHAIPSRMTIGQLIESVLGKNSCKSGCLVDGTPFLRENMHNVTSLLDNSDTEKFIMGTTGQMIETPIAMGMVYYMVLAHQVSDKIYVRSRGTKSMMSRQPISGRSKGGGLRFGYMEYDCLISHGASSLITEVSKNSDSVIVPYCSKCNIITDTSTCKLCDTNTKQTQMPFSYVVLKDLMLAARIKLQTRL